MEIRSVTLICDKANLLRRWENDKDCEWRTNEWLEISVKSLSFFSSLENTIDTSDLSINKVAEMIML